MGARGAGAGGAAVGEAGKVVGGCSLWFVSDMGDDKRLEAMRRNPAGDWKIVDMEMLCREYGVDCFANRSGGSHYKISHSTQREILTLPFNGR